MQRALCARRLQAWDAAHMATMVDAARSCTLSAASKAWASNESPSPRILVALTHAHAGEGHQWVTDDGTRKDRYGLPRKGNIYAQRDAPLTETMFHTALQYRLGLPPTEVHHAAARASGSSGPSLPACQCRTCKGKRPMDTHGHHVLAMTPYGELTRRHHAVVGIISNLLRRAGMRVEQLEFRPFRPYRDADESEADKRLDIVVRGFPLRVLVAWEPYTPLITTMLNGVDRGRTATVDLLIDPTIAHPGARIQDAASDARLPHPDGLGDACALDKLTKYAETARALNRSNALRQPMVVYPAPISCFGRLHPLTYRLVNYAITQIEANRAPNRQPHLGEQPQVHHLADAATEGPLTWTRLSELRAASAGIVTACMGTALRNADHCSRPRGSVPPKGHGRTDAHNPPPPTSGAPVTPPAPLPSEAPVASPPGVPGVPAAAGAHPTTPPTTAPSPVHCPPHATKCECNACLEFTLVTLFPPGL